ncbi:MAG TPA: hypothetical protein PLJ78_04215 [Anaerolineae bacterium]|nr:hypothetical protein [Anaerolineae bacterium]HQK13136.1 hypothetical protein [Anaerolineae bacterium]
MLHKATHVYIQMLIGFKTHTSLDVLSGFSEVVAYILFGVDGVGECGWVF